MNIELFQDKIVIIDDNSKPYLLKLLSNRLINTKIITTSELLKGYFFSYDEKTIYYVCKKNNVCIDVAKRYLDSLCFIDEDSTNSKIHFLYELKRDLIGNDLLKTNSLITDYLQNKDLVLYNLNHSTRILKRIIDKLILNNTVTYLNDKLIDNKKTIIECTTKEDEIALIASKISLLLKSGVSIKNIKITNLLNDYEFSLKRIFKDFNIPVNLNSSKRVFGSIIIQEFIKNYDEDINNTLNKTMPLIKNYQDEKIYKKIINILNNYTWIDNYLDVKEYVLNDLKHITLPSIKYDNAVEVVDLKGYIPCDDDYVFLLSFNDGVIPNEYKDEDFLSDNEKVLVGDNTSLELNEIENNNVLNKIKAINNLVITYSKNINNDEAYISSLYDETYMIKQDYKITYNNSNSFNKVQLISSLDNYIKYGQKDDTLKTLYNSYRDIPYLSYDHKFNGVEAKIDNLELSYSSIDNYYKCAFKYYLKNIMKIDKEEETFSILVGNIFHHILMHFYDNDFDVFKLWDEEITKINRDLKNSEKHFLKRLKKDLLVIIDTLKKQYYDTNLKDVLLEKKVVVPINDKVSFKGFIDKIMYKNTGKNTIATVIDYKTGTPNINIDNIIYGLDMQLPVYVFLIKNSNLFNNVIIGGFYLQYILKNTNDLTEKEKSLQLVGYSNSDLNILKEVDSSYENSNMIKSLKTTQNGFSVYSKVLDNNQIEDISKIVKDNIIKASNEILENKFAINPKEIDDEIISCKYCPYKDICYMDNKDVITLESKKLFGGDKDEVD